jgi:hypothetical protein
LDGLLCIHAAIVTAAREAVKAERVPLMQVSYQSFLAYQNAPGMQNPFPHQKHILSVIHARECRALNPR